MLHQDLWEEILLNFNYDEIEKICSEIPEILIYCERNNVLEKRKFKGFPRSEGKCIYYDVSDLDVETKKLIELERILETTHVYKSNNNINDKQILKQIDEILNNTLKILYENNINLVYGDVICYKRLHESQHEDLNFIFNGHKIISLDEFDIYKSLSKEFNVITNNVPLLYWEYFMNVDSGLWIDVSKLKDQCVNNISIEDEHVISTNFTHNNTNYKIYCDLDAELDFYFDDNGHYDIDEESELKISINKERFRKYIINEDILLLYKTSLSTEKFEEIAENEFILSLGGFYMYNVCTHEKYEMLNS